MRCSTGFTEGCLVLCALVVPTLTSMDAGHIQLPNRPNRCVYTKSYGMATADCLDCNLKTVPQKLKHNIEVLILTQNRLREVTEVVMSRYTRLRFLYLGDNLITHVEPATFTALQNLEVVDLSLNALQTVPPSLLGLPYLRKLYLSQNLLGSLPTTGLEGAPLSPALEFLALAGCRLNQLPPLDAFPKLTFLNVSGNIVGPVRPASVASLCHLEELDARDSPGFTADYCGCHVLQTWFDKRRVHLSGSGSLNCSNELVLPTKCDPLADAELDEAEVVFESCKAAIAERLSQIKTRQTWLWTGVTLASLLATVLLILAFWVRRRKRRAIGGKEEMKIAPENSGGGSHLLGEAEES